MEKLHRVEGFEPTELVKAIDQAVLDGLATNAQIAEELQAYITAQRTTGGFLSLDRDSGSWARKMPARLPNDPTR
jgi:hypothetical protein